MAGKTSAKVSKRKPIDWDAIERDKRTGAFTLRELEAKYGVDNATIARKIKRDRAADPTRWQEDLTEAVRQATSAKLMQATISKEVSKGQQNVSNSVQAAADVNMRVVLAHRARLIEVVESAEAAKATVMTLLSGVADIREAATAMGAIESWSRITKTVIDKEREAFGLNADTKPPASYEQCLQELGA